MRNLTKVATIGLLTALMIMSIGPAAAQQVSPRPMPAQSAEPFVEMLPGVYVYWQWWNESSEAIGPVPLDIRDRYDFQYNYYVEDNSSSGYWILEKSQYNSTNVWSFSNLLVTIIMDPDGSFISWLSTQPKQDNLWTIFWTPNTNALSGDEVFVYSSFYYSKYNYSYSYKAEFTWVDKDGRPVNSNLVIPNLKEEYRWASFMNESQSFASKWHYCGFGYDVNEMTLRGNQTQWMQHYFAGLSVFNDTNHNGIMDVAYESMRPDISPPTGIANSTLPNSTLPVINQTKSELKYSFYAENATIGHVQTPFVNAGQQIEWSVEVVSIEGNLTAPFAQTIGLLDYAHEGVTPIISSIPTRVDSLKMTYRFEVTDEAAVLKIDQYVGNFTIPAGGEILPEAKGLSLALNYWSSFSSSSMVPLAGNSIGAPTLTQSPEAEPISSGNVLFTYGGKPLVTVEFGGTYIWGWDGSVNTVGTAVMPMYLYWMPISSNAPLTNVASGAVPMLSGSYYYSTCYGNWSGYSILHDPVFIAYPGVRPGDVSNRISGIFYATVLLGGAALVVLSGVWIRISRVRKSS
jgi:hypothetical protein